MKISIVYVFPANAGENHVQYALRFIDCYNRFPPGVQHQSLVVLNGAKATSELTCMFISLQNLKLLEHDDSGWDIGAYQYAAATVPCDLMVFFGGSTYFKRAGWLLKMATAFESNGNGIYGCMGNRGDSRCNVHPHIRTTAFWMSPQLLNQYPHKVTNPAQRYEFEHGKTCLTGWVMKQNLRAMVVSWNGVYPFAKWDDIPNGFHRGNQSALLAGDRLTEPPFYRVP